MMVFRNGVAKAFGRNAANWYTVFQASQFHMMYYASRTLPNSFALGLSEWIVVEPLDYLRNNLTAISDFGHAQSPPSCRSKSGRSIKQATPEVRSFSPHHCWHCLPLRDRRSPRISDSLPLLSIIYPPPRPPNHFSRRSGCVHRSHPHSAYRQLLLAALAPLARNDRLHLQHRRKAIFQLGYFSLAFLLHIGPPTPLIQSIRLSDLSSIYSQHIHPAPSSSRYPPPEFALSGGLQFPTAQGVAIHHLRRPSRPRRGFRRRDLDLGSSRKVLRLPRAIPRPHGIHARIFHSEFWHASCLPSQLPWR